MVDQELMAQLKAVSGQTTGGECSCCMQAYFADLDLPTECCPLTLR